MFESLILFLSGIRSFLKYGYILICASKHAKVFNVEILLETSKYYTFLTFIYGPELLL